MTTTTAAPLAQLLPLPANTLYSPQLDLYLNLSTDHHELPFLADHGSGENPTYIGGCVMDPDGRSTDFMDFFDLETGAQLHLTCHRGLTCTYEVTGIDSTTPEEVFDLRDRLSTEVLLIHAQANPGNKRDDWLQEDRLIQAKLLSRTPERAHGGAWSQPPRHFSHMHLPSTAA